MDFDTLDKQMRSFEKSLDRTMIDGIYIVARLDGHGFTRLTKKEWDLERPFDIRFKEAMVHTLRHLMDCGFRIVYGYCESDEISLLFHLDDHTFGRKERKLVSILAAEASVAFSMHAGRAAVFDCRLVPLPGIDYVCDYFRWRQEDCHRNALNAHCYWQLRKLGHSAAKAQKEISGLSHSEKNELLFSHGINYNNLPAWQRRGVGMYSVLETKTGFNPKTGKATTCTRKRLVLDEELPLASKYSTLITNLINASQQERTDKV